MKNGTASVSDILWKLLSQLNQNPFFLVHNVHTSENEMIGNDLIFSFQVDQIYSI